MPNPNKDHYKGTYRARSQAVRLQARLTPTLCARCGQLIEPHQAVDAGHIQDGQIDGPLQAEHATCNRSAGATAGNKKRQGLRNSRQW